MKEKLKHIFTHNLLLKVISLAIAILTWLAFYSSEDPIIQASFDVQVEVKNLEEFKGQGHYISIEGEESPENIELEVYVRGRTSMIEEMRTRDVNSFMEAYVDVYELEDSSLERLMIHYEFTDSAVNRECTFYDIKNTTYLDVDVDDSTTKEIEVVYDITGTPEDGYMYVKDDENIQINPETITLTGPSSQLEKIAYGKVTIRIADANANVNKKRDIVLYNYDDEVVRYSRDVIRASISEASVFVPVYMVKTVALQTYLTGDVPEGYEYGKDVSTDIAKIEIYGPESVMNKINSIPLPTIDLSEITSNYKETFDLNAILEDYTNGEVKLVDPEINEVEVSFTVEKEETKTYTLDTASTIQIAGVKEGWIVTFPAETFDLNIVGIKENLKGFDPESVNFTIRLKDDDYVVGRQKVKVDVTGLGNVHLQEESLTIEIELTKTASSAAS